ncbi:MAG: hypothetical protein U0271_44960 [Polyangiaceae bacterium]
MFRRGLFGIVLLASANCGGESESTDSANGGSTGSHNSVSFSCCINGKGYACPDEAALDKCGGFDIDGCMNACQQDDFDCQDACFAEWSASTPDPSQCNADSSVTCESTGPGTSPTGCSGTPTGASCDVDADCGTYNCFENTCYENAPGNPCDVDADCSSYNCFESCCYGNDAGDPCDVDADCSSYNCYNNVCQ